MNLTPKEKVVITLIAEGYADKEIALRMKISPRTVQAHYNNLRLKLNARNRSNAIAIYLKSLYT